MCDMTSHKAAKLGSIIRDAASVVLLLYPGDDIGSITSVEVSKDGTSAKVLVTALNDPKAVIAFLKEKKGEIKKEIFSRVVIGRLPELRFVFDEETYRIARVTKLLEG